jgi:CDP-paratose 2-epimerase
MTRRMLITGGAGFIGVNACVEFARKAWDITILDNLNRAGAQTNLEWLRQQRIAAFEKADVRDVDAVRGVFLKHGPFDAVLHLAAQVAVTASVQDPRADFEINALGTFNVLETCRLLSPHAAVLNASTNKVYGGMADLRVEPVGDRYRYADLAEGISESRNLEFHSPYGCSKGAAEQYMLDYHRIYGLSTVSFRQSCIYGPRQFGTEDQGWVAWLLIAAEFGMPITIFGDGRQVRDILHVQDLISAYDFAISAIDRVAGTAYNIGGGPANTLSLLEFIALLERRLRRRMDVRHADWRPGDQRVYVSDIAHAVKELCWEPTVPIEKGIAELVDWVRANRDIIGNVAAPGA